jgi:hypothetical protein
LRWSIDRAFAGSGLLVALVILFLAILRLCCLLFSPSLARPGFWGVLLLLLGIADLGRPASLLRSDIHMLGLVGLIRWGGFVL